LHLQQANVHGVFVDARSSLQIELGKKGAD